MKNAWKYVWSHKFKIFVILCVTAVLVVIVGCISSCSHRDEHTSSTVSRTTTSDENASGTSRTNTTVTTTKQINTPVTSADNGTNSNAVESTIPRRTIDDNDTHGEVSASPPVTTGGSTNTAAANSNGISVTATSISTANASERQAPPPAAANAPVANVADAASTPVQNITVTAGAAPLPEKLALPKELTIRITGDNNNVGLIANRAEAGFPAKAPREPKQKIVYVYITVTNTIEKTIIKNTVENVDRHQDSQSHSDSSQLDRRQNTVCPVDLPITTDWSKPIYIPDSADFIGDLVQPDVMCDFIMNGHLYQNQRKGNFPNLGSLTSRWVQYKISPGTPVTQGTIRYFIIPHRY